MINRHLPGFAGLSPFSQLLDRVHDVSGRKGAIAPGSDGDVVVLDPDINRPLSLDDLHLVDYSIWEGWPITGWRVTTILRGKVMVENGALLGQPGDGRLIHREIDPTVLSSPVC